MRANATLKPLFGGCPGGNSGSWACTTSGGGGGGAVQISAAGALSVAGSITANGGAGGASACSAQQNLCGITYPGGGGGGGSGGAVLLEGETVTTTGSTITVNGGSGGKPQAGAGAGGSGGTSSSPAGGAGTGSAGACGPANQAGGGGGGGYGYYRTNTGAAPTYSCASTLSPAPVPNGAHTACLCVADSDCPSGRCVNASSQCTGACTGGGAADGVDCQLVTSVPTAWSCSIGNCRDVISPSGTCIASGVRCWCTNDSQCGSGKCASWAGCASGACTASGAADAFNCVR
jgi:hypothetical protein